MNRNRLRALAAVLVGFPLLAFSAHCQAPLFPDTSKTPGVVRLDTVKGVVRPPTAKEVCVPGSSKKVRNVPTSEKNAVYKEYGILNRKPGSYEIDHDISLELGGSNEIGNLWPEIYDINVGGFNEGAHTKDALENKLHSLMCAGALTMVQAQNAIRGDWRVAYKKYVSPTFPKYVAPKVKKPIALAASSPFTFAMQRDTVTGPYITIDECTDWVTLVFLSGQSKEAQAEFKRLNPELYAGAVRANNKIIAERQK